MTEAQQGEVLQEYVNSYGVSVRVDKAKGMLEGVKLIGLESRNGRRYRESTLGQAVSLYEGAKVNVNHPKAGPLAPRDYEDRLGVIRSVRMLAGKGLYGDLHFNPKHALAEQLVWDAENNPRNVGFSHNVLARLSRKEGDTVVEEITQVRSVDLVADPATTQGLFEQAAGERKSASNMPGCWDALTVETLRLHRPDLLEEVESAELECLQSKLEEAERQSENLQRSHRILELLSEHHLSAPTGKGNAQGQNNSSATVSQAFFEMLTTIEPSDQVEELIAERAELVRSTVERESQEVRQSLPKSRDQMSSFALQTVATHTAQDFSRCLRSSLN